MQRAGKPRGDYSYISFGPRLRADETARFVVYHVDEIHGEAHKLIEQPIPRKGRVRLPSLEHFENYLVIVKGETAGIAATNGLALKHPFYLTIDADPVRSRQAPAVSRVAAAVGRAVRRSLFSEK